MNLQKSLIISILSGLILGLLGVHLMGYVAAVSIPKGYILWFKENLVAEIGMILLGIVEQFFSFGILALITGYILGKLTISNWFRNSVICYLSVWFYISVGTAFVYGVPISNPFAGVPLIYIIPAFVLPVCLMSSTYLASTRYNKPFKQD